VGFAWFGILNNEKTIFQTKPVTGPAQRKAGTEEIPVLMLCIYPGGIVNDVCVDMGVVNVPLARK